MMPTSHNHVILILAARETEKLSPSQDENVRRKYPAHSFDAWVFRSLSDARSVSNIKYSLRPFTALHMRALAPVEVFDLAFKSQRYLVDFKSASNCPATLMHFSLSGSANQLNANFP